MNNREAALRISEARGRKAARRREFIQKLAKRKGIELSEGICQDLQVQIVREVIPAAGGCFYRSSACSGCLEGERFLLGTPKGETPEEILGCFMIRDHWLWSNEPLEIGQRVSSNNLLYECGADRDLPRFR